MWNSIPTEIFNTAHTRSNTTQSDETLPKQKYIKSYNTAIKDYLHPQKDIIQINPTRLKYNQSNAK